MFPFGSSSLAQNIINSKLSGVSASTPMQPQDMNANNVFRNPYSPAGFYANETDSKPKPAFVAPTADEQGNPQCNNAEGYYYDPVTQTCKLVEQEVTNNNNDNNTTTTPPYQGVGSVLSPEQNAFMNLGLGGSTADTVKSYYGSGEIDPYGTGIKGFFNRFTPLGQLNTYLNTNRLVNAGILNRGANGALTFAKGGNLALAKANQAFEQDLARKQGLNLDAKADQPYKDQLGNEVFMVQSRGDKADDMGGDPYKGLNVTTKPFQSQYGANKIVSYPTKTRGSQGFEPSRAGSSVGLNRIRGGI